MNGKKATPPCQCGYLGMGGQRCKCTPQQVLHYRSRISGPLLDRIDLHIDVNPLTDEELVGEGPGESSRAVRERAACAHSRQIARQGRVNARVGAGEVEERMRLDPAGRRMMRDAAARLGLSARAHHRVLRVARTVADLAAEPEIHGAHVAEALHYRGLRLPPAA